jgi:hypothetical protein
MAEDKGRAEAGKGAVRFLGSLRDALAAAGREDAPPRSAALATAKPAPAASAAPPPVPAEPAGPPAAAAAPAAEATPADARADRPVEAVEPPTTRVARGARPAQVPPGSGKTELLRGRNPIKRGQFHQDPVVGWLVVVGGLGLGSYRPIYEGNNTIGRASSQRIPIDFGDDSISAEEQAYIRYDSAERSFLFVPNLAKTNVVSINDRKPTSAVPLSAMDVITMGRTQLVFMPFCGPEFDWSDLTDAKA